MSRRYSFFAVLFTLSLAQIAIAGIPGTISYQGLLTDQNGNVAVDGNYKLTFKLTTNPNNTAVLWEEIHKNVAVENGLFQVILGSISPIDLEFDEPY